MHPPAQFGSPSYISESRASSLCLSLWLYLQLLSYDACIIMIQCLGDLIWLHYALL